MTEHVPVELEVRDQRFHALIAPDTVVRRVAGGFRFVEGPVWLLNEHALIFSDILGSTIYRWTETGGVQPVRKPSNMANGNTLDREGRLLTCEHATSRVVRAEDDGSVRVLASHYDGKELNSPNDIVVKSDGAVYFTDPTSGRTASWGVEREPQLAVRGVYRLDPETGALTLLVDDFAKPNGLCFSADEQVLFVNDTERAHIRAFDVLPDGTLTGGRLWATLVAEGEGVADGMKIDAAGNVYSCGPGGIHVLAPDATSLGVIRLPEKVANFTWGDADHSTLYITASTSVYALQTLVRGYR